MDKVNWISLAVVAGCTAVFMIGAIIAYDPVARPGPPGPSREARHEQSDRRHRGALVDLGREHCAWPPIRVIPTGRAFRPRCRKSRWPPSGPDRRIDDVASANGRTTPRSAALVVEHLAARTHADGGGPEGDHGVFCRARRDKTVETASCCSPACSTRSTPSARRCMNGLERVTPQTARGGRQDPRRYDPRCRRCRARHHPTRRKGRRAQQPVDLGNPHLRGPAATW